MMDGHVVIETPRLRLRRWLETDLAPFIELNADPEVMRYFPETCPEERSLDLYQQAGREFEECGFGPYAAEEKNSGAFIGFIGFHRADFEADFCPCIEICWRLAKQFWNRGYATEGAKACLAYGFERLDFERVYSFTALLNGPSQRVMQKIGMNLDRYFNHPDVPRESPLYPHVCYLARPAGE